MKHIGIQTPCSEDRSNMTPNEKGSFCHKCAKQVHDFTNKSTGEIKQLFRGMIGQEVCGRLTSDQEMALNAEFEAWKFQSKQGFQRAMVFSLVVVFGLTLFSCSNEQDRQQIKEIQAVALNAMNVSAGETPDASLLEQQTIPEIQDQVLKVMHIERSILLENRCTLEKSIQMDPSIKFMEIHQIDGGIGMSMDYQEYLIEKMNPVEYDNDGKIVPVEFSATVFPNPVTDQTTFELAIPVKNHFTIKLYDMNGKFIQDVHSGELECGTFRQQINLTDLNPGIYLVTILSKDYKETVRISKI